MSPPGPPGTASFWRLPRAVLRPTPQGLTLEQLRGDLSHETAAKLARLSGLIQEWRRGNARAADAADAAAILADLERIHLRHARLAAASFGTFARLARLLRALRRGRDLLRAVPGPGAPPPAGVERFAGLYERLRRDSQALCETLSARHGVRFATLAAAAVEEMRGEAGDTDAGGVAIAFEGGEEPRTWVPRRDAEPWADIVRNLVRNAVQATEEARTRAPAAGGTDPPRRGVAVRLLPMREQPGTTIEVLDEGVGMGAEAVAAMWRAGQSRHGGHHGQGLTESKRAFVESRAALEVRSAEGAGTCVRVDLPHRDVPVRSPRLWALPPVVAPALAALAAVVLAGSALFQPTIVSVDVLGDRTVRALDGRSRVIWQRDLPEKVEPNFLGYLNTGPDGSAAIHRFLVLPRRWPWPSNVILATRPPEGPGRLWRLGLGGRTVWKRTLDWIPPRRSHAGSLKSVSQMLVPWDRRGRDVIATNVRDADWASTAIQFLTPEGERLGAYYHPGHLEYRATTDLDGDGHAELILSGKNNRAPEDSTVYPEPPGEEWVDCLVMLETPQVDGQAYPGTGWAGVPPAREAGYLLVPPLRRGPRQGLERPVIDIVDVGRSAAPGDARVEVRLKDGRIYTLDSHLRPLSCGVGSATWAATLAPTRALAPLLYFHDGRREAIDLPVQRGP